MIYRMVNMGKVLNPVTLGPVDKKEAERLAKA